MRWREKKVDGRGGLEGVLYLQWAAEAADHLRVSSALSIETSAPSSAGSLLPSHLEGTCGEKTWVKRPPCRQRVGASRK